MNPRTSTFGCFAWIFRMQRKGAELRSPEFISFGIAFEMPIVVVLLTLMGVVSVEKLGNSRGYVVVGIAIVAAILTPSYDAVSQLAMAIPMMVLSGICIVLTAIALISR